MPIRLQPPAPDQLVEATKTFEIEVDGEVLRAIAGKTRVRGNHPLVRAHPEAWQGVKAPEFETATAAPGERRGE